MMTPRLDSCLVTMLLAARVSALPAASLTGTVLGDGGRPVAGARVEVVGSDPPCATTTAADGTFALECAVMGAHVVRASFGELRPWEIAGVELEPGSSAHLNFLLLGPAPVAVTTSVGADSEVGFWNRRLPDPVVATWGGSEVRLRLAAIVAAALSFVLGAFTMIALGRRFGIEARTLSKQEVGDMVLNPVLPSAAERVTPVAVAGARGASATVRYGADEIATALRAGRYGLVLVALLVAPGLFALSSVAFAAAMLIGHELYLFCLLLLVPAGFLLTAAVVGAQAWSRWSR